MSIRTPSTNQNRQSLLDLQRTQERLLQNQTRIATGNRLTSVTDDPTAAAAILSFGNSIQANSQFVKQADAAAGFLQSSEDVVSSAVDSNMRLQELAVQGLDPNATAADRVAVLAEVDSIRTNLLALANTQVQGKYIFAGNQTQTLPFVDAAPPAVPTYAGNSGVISLDVTSTTAVATNIPGDQVFFGNSTATNFFQAITDLHNGLTTNNTALIQTAADNLKTVLDHLSQVRTELGGRQSGLSSLKDTLSGFNVTLQDLQNNQQSTDYAQAAIEFTQDQTIQSATLSAMAKSNKTNLFDFLA